jgi:carbonic anhydrase
MQEIEELFANNRAWAERVTRDDPEFFQRLAQLQAPTFLWIGCSDSRVPANQITGLPPGAVFVHRNIANIVASGDLNCLSVLQFAIDVLNVRHVIVCGHYGCGGVRAAIEHQQHGLVDDWLRHVQNVYAKHRSELDKIGDGETRSARLCELNVIEQVENVRRTTIVGDAWARGQALSIHGWIYDIANGLLRDLGTTSSGPSK